MLAAWGTAVLISCPRADDILTALRLARELGLVRRIEHCTEGHLITDLLKNSLKNSRQVLSSARSFRACKNRNEDRTFHSAKLLHGRGYPFALMTVPSCSSRAMSCPFARRVRAVRAWRGNRLKSISIVPRVYCLDCTYWQYRTAKSRILRYSTRSAGFSRHCGVHLSTVNRLSKAIKESSQFQSGGSPSCSTTHAIIDLKAPETQT